MFVRGFVESSKEFNKILLWIKPSYFQHGSSLSLETCATPGAYINETGLFSSAAVVPQSQSTELCSWAVVVPRRLGRFCDIYCAIILRYSFALRVISDILWSRLRTVSYFSLQS